jgi:large subunit ribosomal protein L30
MTAETKSSAGGAKKSGHGTLKIKWVVSFIGCPRGMRQTIRGLGFRRMQQVVEREDNAATRGMILKVRHLVEVQEAAQQKGRPRAEKAHDNLHEKKREIASEP